MDLASISSSEALNDLLVQWDVPAAPPSNEVGHWWQFAWGGNPPSISTAIAGNYNFVITFRSSALELHVMDEGDDWFNLVGYFPDRLPETQIADGIRQILAEDWRQLMYRCRRLKFEFAWAADLVKFGDGYEISPELRELVFDFSEALVGDPNVPVLEQKLSDIAQWLIKSNGTRPTSYLMLRTCISPGMFHAFRLPEKDKQVLEEFGELLEMAAKTNALDEQHLSKLGNAIRRLAYPEQSTPP